MTDEQKTATATAIWQDRELVRFADGTYRGVPVSLPYPPEHYLHLSVTETETDAVAYTPSDDYGIRDRQIRLKFGRYLKKTFPEMSDAEIQGHVATLKSELSIADVKPELHFATTRAEMNRIFETQMCAHGSNYTSCMFAKFDDNIRPYHVYADSPDVAVAYMTANGDIKARSVVSMKDKGWIRLYSVSDGDNDADCTALRRMLEASRYGKGDLLGNRLTKLDTAEVMLPYIDNGGCDVHESHCGKYWIVVESGEYTANCTDGTATKNFDLCESCGNQPNDCDCTECEGCGERSQHGCEDCDHCGCCESVTRNGCEECSLCEDCDGCIWHDGCSCPRCSDCEEIINPRHHWTTACDCDRCSECHELTGKCECEPDNDSDDSETRSLIPAPTERETAIPMSYESARQFVQRAHAYLTHQSDQVSTRALVILSGAFQDVLIAERDDAEMGRYLTPNEIQMKLSRIWSYIRDTDNATCESAHYGIMVRASREAYAESICTASMSSAYSNNSLHL
jgi:hypothetical protein